MFLSRQGRDRMVQLRGLTFELTPRAEAGAVSPGCDDLTGGAARAYGACRSESGVERGVRPRRAQRAWAYGLHHWRSQGIPLRSPSILTPGQLARKYLASAQDVIWEQCVLPSQRKPALISVGGGGTGVAAGLALGSVLAPDAAAAEAARAARFLCSALICSSVGRGVWSPLGHGLF